MSDIEVAHAKSLLRREIDATHRFTADYFVSSDMVESGEHAGCTRASVELNERSRRCVDILRELALLVAACSSSSSDPTEGDDDGSVEAAPFTPPTAASPPFLHDRDGAFIQGDADCDSPYWAGSTPCK
jgi:hypothetical protein